MHCEPTLQQQMISHLCLSLCRNFYTPGRGVHEMFTFSPVQIKCFPGETNLEKGTGRYILNSTPICPTTEKSAVLKWRHHALADALTQFRNESRLCAVAGEMIARCTHFWRGKLEECFVLYKPKKLVGISPILSKTWMKTDHPSGMFFAVLTGDSALANVSFRVWF